MGSWPSVVSQWGSTAAERAEAFACDELVAEPDLVLFRAVEVRARPETVFRWLCQLREAPYSYDLIDNAGRRSPRTLTPGLERLEPGQRVMRIFKLAGFEPGSSITILTKGRLFGLVACTYRVRAVGSGRTRLVVKVLVRRTGRSIVSRALGGVLAPGDLVMMRRQLLNLRRLAEAQGASPSGDRGQAGPVSADASIWIERIK